MIRLALAAAALAATLASCGERVCLPGDHRSCPCPDGSQAIQACGADGFYGACGCGGGPPADLAGPPADLDGPPADLAGDDGGSGGGNLPFGALCAGAGLPGCAPGLVCDRFVMGTVFRCTRMCPGNVCDATCCPPPSAGACNAKNECKFTM
jgi:hypothetical protein